MTVLTKILTAEPVAEEVQLLQLAELSERRRDLPCVEKGLGRSFHEKVLSWSVSVDPVPPTHTRDSC